MLTLAYRKHKIVGNFIITIYTYNYAELTSNFKLVDILFSCRILKAVNISCWYIRIFIEYLLETKCQIK